MVTSGNTCALPAVWSIASARGRFLSSAAPVRRFSGWRAGERCIGGALVATGGVPGRDVDDDVELVLADEETALQLRRAVGFRGMAHVQDFLPMSKRDILKFEGGALAWKQALANAGVTLDVDGGRAGNLPFLVYQYGLLSNDIGGASAGGIIAVFLANIVAFFLMRMIGKNLDA